MGLRDEIAGKYLDADGLVNPSPINPTDRDKTGNGLLYTSLYYMLLFRRKEQKYGDLERYGDSLGFSNVIARCWANGADGYPIYGLLQRSPTKTDLESADDYYGVVAAINKVYLSIWQKDRILRYGLYRNYGIFRWNYNNRDLGDFTFATWFGRFPWLPAHIQWCAGIKPNILRRLAWALKITVDSFSHSPEARIKGWLMIESVGDSRLCKWAVRRWTTGLYARVPNGMRDVMAEYFGSYHPLALYWVD